VPIDPPSPVKFEEFDGLNRMLFSRENKTTNTFFLAKGVLEMVQEILEENGFKGRRAVKMSDDLPEYDSVPRTSGFTDIQCALPGCFQHFPLEPVSLHSNIAAGLFRTHVDPGPMRNLSVRS